MAEVLSFLGGVLLVVAFGLVLSAGYSLGFRAGERAAKKRMLNVVSKY